MTYPVKVGQTAQAIVFGPIVLASDHISPATGLVAGTTLTVTISKNGAAYGAPAGAVTEIGVGFYKIAGNATDEGTTGPLAVHAVGTAADLFDQIPVQVVSYDPLDGVHLGLTCLPNVATGAAGALPTTGTGANQINVTGGVVDSNLLNVTGTAISQGIARTSGSNSLTQVALPSGWSSPANINLGDKLEFFAGTGTGESGPVIGLTGLGGATPVAITINTGWSGGVTPDGTTKLRVFPGYGLVPVDGSTLASATQLGAVQSSVGALQVLLNGVNITQCLGLQFQGTGTLIDPFRPVGVSPAGT